MDIILRFLILIILGLLPSFIWLLYFLRKDVNPEPKKMVLKIFLYGMLSPLPIIIFVILLYLFELQLLLFYLFKLEPYLNIALPILLFLILNILFWATLEEVLKYLVVKINLKSAELDEPTDIMLYMIIAGLGFAATENILILLGVYPPALPDLIFLAFLRFISATVLHASCSGIIGYFLALSFFETKKRKYLFLKGIIIASLLHWFYNFAILVIGGIFGALIIITVVISLFIFILFGFKKLKKMKGVCKIHLI